MQLDFPFPDGVAAEVVFDAMIKERDNQLCFDCKSPCPQWASVNNSILICINCAGVHRGLGVQVSFVRSSTMDGWNPKQLRYMHMGGNKRFQDFLNQYDLMQESAQTRYSSNAAYFYRQQLKCNVEGVEFNELAPNFSDGKQQKSMGQPRTQEEIMYGNGQIGSHMYDQQNQQQVQDYSVANDLKSGLF